MIIYADFAELRNHLNLLYREMAVMRHAEEILQKKLCTEEFGIQYEQQLRFVMIEMERITLRKKFLENVLDTWIEAEQKLRMSISNMDDYLHHSKS